MARTLKSVPREEIATDSQLKQFESDSLYMTERTVELLAKYPQQWVAVYHHEVIGHDPDLPYLFEQISRKGASVGDVVVRFMTDEHTPVL